MGPEGWSRILRGLRRHLDAPAGGGPGDGELLERFLKRRDEAAFELLVWRHGPMVRATCRRVLRQAADVDDAFQATFLVLVRRGGAIRRREALGGWLYQVASRLALRLRAAAARRALKERAAVPAASPAPAGDVADLGPVLDEEIGRLPAAYRAPFVLCHLEGKTNAEAARELGCPRGTVQSRLTRARERLRQRLLRRGVGPAAVAAAAGMAPPAEAVPAALVGATLQTVTSWVRGSAAAAQVAAPVAALTEGVLNAMWWTKMQALTGTVLVLAVAFGTGSWAYQASAQPVPGPGGRADAVTPRASQDRGDSHAQDELTDLLKKLAAEQQALEAQRAQLEANLKLLQQQAQAHEKQRQDVEAKLKELLRQREYRLTEDEQAKRRQKALKAVALALDELKTADPENPAVRAFEGSYQKLLASYGPPASANYAKELYYDLLKRAQEADHAERLKVYPRDPAKGPPDLEGKVLVVKDPFVVISLGAQAGLTKGAVLTAYRNGPKPVYLGRLTVVEVVADSAVCETAQGPKGKLLDGLQVGDAVTTKLLETK